jgi:hypothetical protein
MRPNVTFTLMLQLAASGVLGCAAPEAPTPAPTRVPSDEGNASEGQPTGAAPCEAPIDSPSLVSAPSVKPGSPPEATGGAVIDGGYELTSLTRYSADAAAPVPDSIGLSLVIAGASLRSTYVSPPSPPEAASWTMETQGVEFTQTETCGDGTGRSVTGRFTASSDRLILYLAEGGVIDEWTLTRR